MSELITQLLVDHYKQCALLTFLSDLLNQEDQGNPDYQEEVRNGIEDAVSVCETLEELLYAYGLRR